MKFSSKEYDYEGYAILADDVSDHAWHCYVRIKNSLIFIYKNHEEHIDKCQSIKSVHGKSVFPLTKNERDILKKHPDDILMDQVFALFSKRELNNPHE